MEKILIDGDILVNTIAKKLNEFFNSEENKYTIYRNQVVSDMSEPCFFINILQINRNKVGRNRWKYKFITDIRYHSDLDISKLNQELDNMGIKMLDCLTELYINSYRIKIPEDNAYCEKQNNILHVFINYELQGTQEEMVSLMQNLDMKEDILNG